MNCDANSNINTLILVDGTDVAIGSMEKVDAHSYPGFRHRAFSLFLFNSLGQLYIQKRSEKKLLWPEYWSNSCCSHPEFGEDVEAAVVRRAKEELGIDLADKPTYLYKFSYYAEYEKIGCENEVCYVFCVKTDQIPIVNSDEVAEGKFIELDRLESEFFVEEKKYTPWFKMEWDNILLNHFDSIKKIIESDFLSQ